MIPLPCTAIQTTWLCRNAGRICGTTYLYPSASDTLPVEIREFGHSSREKRVALLASCVSCLQSRRGFSPPFLSLSPPCVLRVKCHCVEHNRLLFNWTQSTRDAYLQLAMHNFHSPLAYACYAIFSVVATRFYGVTPRLNTTISNRYRLIPHALGANRARNTGRARIQRSRGISPPAKRT